MTGSAPTSATMLRALADLAPGAAARWRSLLDATSSGRSVVWLAPHSVPVGALFVRVPQDGVADVELPAPVTGARQASAAVPAQESTPNRTEHIAQIRRLAAADALHREEHLLRLGWIWLVGTLRDGDGGATSVCHPLVSAPVRLLDGPAARLSGSPRLDRAGGDVELTPLADDGSTGDDSETAPLDVAIPFAPVGYRLTETTLQRFPVLRDWVGAVTERCGFANVPLVAAGESGPVAPTDGIVAVATAGLYLGRAVDAVDLGTALRNWSTKDDMERSAFAAVFTPETASVTERGRWPEHEPPLVLSAEQHDAVRRARDERVVVISGGPGSGKSHVAVAVALDALAMGRSVLVATQTEHAAEVLADRLHEAPGPPPVVFGGSERRREIAARLGAGLDVALGRRDVNRVAVGFSQASERRSWTLDALGELLEREQLAASAQDTPSALVQLAAPGAFDPSVDIDELDVLLAHARSTGSGWWIGRRRRGAEQKLRKVLDARADVPLDRLADAVQASRSRRAAVALAVVGGTRLGDAWDDLDAADAAVIDAAGRLLSARARTGAARSDAARNAAGALAVALRSGRTARRRQLRRIDHEAMVRALPLWVGTLRDIDDLLPAHTAMFDVVVLDEASQIDLPRAATALARAHRAVVVGDPHQLRHVSFVGDASVDDVARSHGLPDTARARLDVRRLSALDVAATVCGPTTLMGHYRCVPHLIDFSARRFSQSPVQVMTRHPGNDRRSAIEVCRVDGQRTASGTNVAELDAVDDLVRRLVDQGCRSIGVLSPLRAQADALEGRLIDRLTLDEIEQHGVRTGTVHAFQGNERDVVVLSLVLDDDAPAASRRFIEDPNLFNVMVTRARERMIVVTSLTDPPTGLLADYLTYATAPPTPPPPVPVDDQWTEDLAAELERNGVTVQVGYPVGAMVIDLVVGDGDAAVGLECRVHPAGAVSHIVRHQTLRRAGWRLHEAWSTRWDADAARGALAVVDELGLARHG